MLLIDGTTFNSNIFGANSYGLLRQAYQFESLQPVSLHGPLPQPLTSDEKPLPDYSLQNNRLTVTKPYPPQYQPRAQVEGSRNRTQQQLMARPGGALPDWI